MNSSSSSSNCSSRSPGSHLSTKSQRLGFSSFHHPRQKGGKFLRPDPSESPNHKASGALGGPVSGPFHFMGRSSRGRSVRRAPDAAAHGGLHGRDEGDGGERWRPGALDSAPLWPRAAPPDAPFRLTGRTTPALTPSLPGVQGSPRTRPRGSSSPPRPPFLPPGP